MHPSAHSMSVEASPIAVLYDRYGAIIFAYLRRHAVSQEDAEDLLLEVFLAALEHRQLAQMPETGRLAWLQRVAHNKLADHYRRSVRRATLTLEEVAETLEMDEMLAPEQVALWHEEQGRVHTLIQRLPKLQQDVLHLRFAAGLRTAEIAHVLGKRDGAVRMVLSRTLNLLRALYEEG